MDRVDDPVLVLIQEVDERLRADAHLILGHQAAKRDNTPLATKHFREAALLDPESDRPRQALHSIGKTLNPSPVLSAGLRRFMRVAPRG